MEEVEDREARGIDGERNREDGSYSPRESGPHRREEHCCEQGGNDAGGEGKKCRRALLPEGCPVLR